MLKNLKDLQKELRAIKRTLKKNTKVVEEIRAHYEYQGPGNKSISNDLAVIYNNLEIEDALDCIGELIENNS